MEEWLTFGQQMLYFCQYFQTSTFSQPDAHMTLHKHTNDLLTSLKSCIMDKSIILKIRSCQKPPGCPMRHLIQAQMHTDLQMWPISLLRENESEEHL